MAVPKRKHSKKRTGIQTFARNKRSIKQAVKTKTGIKRPHVEEDLKI